MSGMTEENDDKLQLLESVSLPRFIMASPECKSERLPLEATLSVLTITNAIQHFVYSNQNTIQNFWTIALKFSLIATVHCHMVYPTYVPTILNLVVSWCLSSDIYIYFYFVLSTSTSDRDRSQKHLNINSTFNNSDWVKLKDGDLLEDQGQSFSNCGTRTTGGTRTVAWW
jgi:hypothetical protein